MNISNFQNKDRAQSKPQQKEMKPVLENCLANNELPEFRNKVTDLRVMITCKNLSSVYQLVRR